MNKSKYLAWIDLEMTGLDCNKDVILEIAALITDNDLNIIAYGPDIIVNQSQVCLDQMLPIVQELHHASGLTKEVLASITSLKDAENLVLSFFSQYGEVGTIPLCGNSIWQDKMFLINHMPRLVSFFHYRIIDVSTIKELICRWYDANEFKKTKKHRALSDIEESVSELKFYRDKYFIKIT